MNSNSAPLKKEEIASYSSEHQVFNVYDNMYFDSLNGSLIDVKSNEINGNVSVSGNVDATIEVLPRSSEYSMIYELKNENDQLPKPNNVLNSSYKAQLYEKNDEDLNLNVFYIPWKKDTYLHLIETTSEPYTNVSSYLFSDNNVAHGKQLNDSVLEIKDYVQDTNDKNNTEVLEPAYNSKRKVFQMSQFVQYDMKNGNLILKNSNSNTLDVLNRQNGSKMVITYSDKEADKETTHGDKEELTNVKYDVKTYTDMEGGNVVLYITNSLNTLVAIIGKDIDGSLTMKNLKRFTPSGVDDGTIMQTEEAISESDNEEESKDVDLNDYILKTQVVPPVCPAYPSCPTCPTDGACSNCGGNGGSGTLTKKGESTVAGDAISNLPKDVGNVAENTAETVADVGEATVGAAGELGKATLVTATTVGEETVGAVSNVGEETVGAVGAVGEATLDTAGNVGKATLDTAGKLGKSAISNISKIGSSLFGNEQQNNQNKESSNMKQPNNQINSTNDNKVNQPINNSNNQNAELPGVSNDPYSYYGQIPTKESTEFMPITANFSSFGK